MGSSVKRKKEKKKDFQKPKLKVGKAKPKPENHTDTSFRSKAIVLNQQSLREAAPTVAYQFQHNLSLLGSRTDSQRKDSLSYLTTYLQSKLVDEPLPHPAGTILEKACPLILDGSQGVRTQLLKFFMSLSTEDINDHVIKILPFIRAGMTHLSRDVRTSAIDVLSWLLNTAAQEVVSCSGGWQKTLESFVTLLGWRQINDKSSWSSGKATFGTDVKTTTRVIHVLAQLLSAGLLDDKEGKDLAGLAVAEDLIWQTSFHAVPTKSNAYLHLNLFGMPRAEDNRILEDREDRLQIFNEHFRSVLLTGVEVAKQEGGEPGRAAGLLTKILKQSDVSD